jgi:ureidoglycolate lyase
VIREEIKELTKESFSKYGQFQDMLNPYNAVVFGEAPVRFFIDMLQLELGTATTVSFSTCRVEKRNTVIDSSEYHNNCGEGILPMDSDIIIHVAPPTAGEINAEEIELFHVPKKTMVILRPGVWHQAPFAYGNDSANILIVLPERTYAKDCYVTELPNGRKVEFNQ